MHNTELINSLGYIAHNRFLLVEEVRGQVESAIDPLVYVREKLCQLGIQADLPTKKEALFLLQGLMDHIASNECFEQVDALKAVHLRISQMKRQHNWMFNVEPEQEAYVKPRSKTEVAYELFKSIMIDNELSNADLVKAYQQQLNMSLRGARTYAYNMRIKYAEEMAK